MFYFLYCSSKILVKEYQSGNHLFCFVYFSFCRSYSQPCHFWTVWSYICVICAIFLWYSSFYTFSCIWCALFWQVLYISCWSSGKSNYDLCMLNRLKHFVCLFVLLSSYIHSQLLKLNFFISMSAPSVILEKIYFAGGMWHSCGFLLSSEHLPYPQGKGYILFMAKLNKVDFFFFPFSIWLQPCLSLVTISNILYLTVCEYQLLPR